MTLDSSRLNFQPCHCCLLACAQLDALRHCTQPSIIPDKPALNLSSSTISRFATASVSCIAAETKDSADSFFSCPDLVPNNPLLVVKVDVRSRIYTLSLHDHADSP